MTRVLVVNVQYPDYPRHQRIVEHFTRAGAHVDVIAKPTASGPRVLRPFVRGSRLVAAARARGVRYDVVVLAEFGSEFALASWVIARTMRAVHVVDGFVGLHETFVEDRGFVGPRSPVAFALRVLDRVAFRVADVYVIDTDVRGRAVAAVSPSARVQSVTLPVGAPPWVHPVVRCSDPSGPLAILYYGNFIPLHGVDLLIRAVAAAAEEVDVRLTLVGDGQTRTEAEALVDHLGLRGRCDFRPPVAPDELMTLMEAHDVVAGVFGTSSKAQSVIANKVWQGLASGSLVVTQTSPALDEIRSLVPTTLREVDTEGHADLTRCLVDLAHLKRRGTLPPADTGALARLSDYVADRYLDLDAAITRARRRLTREA